MELRVVRVDSGEDATLGVWIGDPGTPAAPNVGAAPLCYTLEDRGRRGPKVKGATRIPAGRYELKLRREGGFHIRYGARFGTAFHRGMLHLQDVPGFTFILVHCGNGPADTEGCILLGERARRWASRGRELMDSEAAYRRIYPPIAAALERGERVYLTIEDHGEPPA